MLVYIKGIALHLLFVCSLMNEKLTIINMNKIAITMNKIAINMNTIAEFSVKKKPNQIAFYFSSCIED